MTETIHLGLPYLAAAQAQKHVTHNEALSRLDAVVQLAVIDTALTAPPVSPAEGDRYIVADSATGAWAGHDGEIAAFIDGVWVLIEAGSGWLIFDLSAEAVLVRHDDAWVAVGSFLGAVTRFGVNTAADATNRLAVKSNAVLLTGVEAGAGGTGDLRVVVNKEADADTASLLFQSGFSGRAEVGLAGDTDFVFKVSADGSAWTEAIRIDKDTGLATLAADPTSAMHAATKQYVDGIVGTPDAMVFKGVIDCSANPNYPAADRGWTYRVSVAGKIGGGSGVNVEAGDLILCLTDGTSSGNQATVGANWSVAQTNLDGAVIGPASAVSGRIATFSGTSGKIIQDGGKALPAGTVVGTSDAQTLTNKTLTSPAISSPTGMVKGDVGLGNVDNTSDANKPVSTATQIALDAKAVAANMIGQVCYFALNSAPTDFLKANGAAVSRTTYAALFAKIGTTFGVGDGSTTFNLPDGRGEFIRGWDDGRGVDSGRTFGSAQSSQNLSHTHGIPERGDGSGAFTAFYSNTGGFAGSYITSQSSGGGEARPRNIALLACIRYQ